ncbi:hypothetical protein WL22_15315 [Burkholderia ubonensis]|uniref:Uncharacterized protein n=2 Tax=Burkholderia ubonensis TaxID=101571 RepID=A0AAW3MTB6_9BURK|nr:hypothetical protein WJ75_16915 [Burkholderia ubonensis]KVP95092.1 hypothetical protein WJ96_10630 [Burkholderia ubonensis]KVX16486.1 hypothetical protein WL02_17430 [Burkholderia ubonensis]KVZ95784.1 hypothetical protein WL22_15315 [Burkholderia ubonensis]KWA00926.1 hypothetical protein WL25_04875 [Burkholderia ubonensis]
MGGFLARSNPPGQLLVHQRQPDVVLRAVEQFAQPIEFAEYLKHAREDMQLHAWIAGLQSLDRTEPRTDALGQRLLRQSAPTPASIDVAAQFLERALHGDRQRPLSLTALNRAFNRFNGFHETHHRSRQHDLKINEA